MLDVTEETVREGLGQVMEPDIAKCRVVCGEALDGEDEGFNNLRRSA